MLIKEEIIMQKIMHQITGAIFLETWDFLVELGRFDCEY